MKRKPAPVPTQSVCAVCGRTYATKDLWVGMLYHPGTCKLCYVWFRGQSTDFMRSRFPQGAGAYTPCNESQTRRMILQERPYKCVLPKGHVGAHISCGNSGEIFDAWNLNIGFIGLSIHDKLRTTTNFPRGA